MFRLWAKTNRQIRGRNFRIYQKVHSYAKNSDREDIGNMALFLCSDLAKNITGQAVNVCGGMRMN